MTSDWGSADCSAARMSTSSMRPGRMPQTLRSMPQRNEPPQRCAASAAIDAFTSLMDPRRIPFPGSESSANTYSG